MLNGVAAEQIGVIANQFIRFSGVGVIGTSGHYVVLIALVQLGGADPVIASTLGFIVGALINYYLSYHFVFRSSARHRDGLPKFITVALTGMIINTAVMALLTSQAFFPYLVNQVIATTCVLFWNFFGNRLWTFRAT